MLDCHVCTMYNVTSVTLERYAGLSVIMEGSHVSHDDSKDPSVTLDCVTLRWTVYVQCTA